MSNPLDDRIPEIRQRVTIEDELARRGHSPARTTGGRAVYHCPLPGHDDRSPSFDCKDDYWHCRSQCGTSGDVVDLVMALDACSKQAAIETLAERIGLERGETPSPRRRSRALGDERASWFLEQFALKRSWPGEVLREVGAHVVLDDWGHPRCRFPFVYGDEVVYHQDRTIYDAKPKWLSPKGGTPALYNANALRLPGERDGELLLVEGVSDVIALLSVFAEPAVVGTPGTGVFPREWSPIFAGLRQVDLIADNDVAGERFRGRVHAILDPVVGRVVDVYVPQAFNDIDEWRRACPDDFGTRLEDAIASAERVEVAA